MSRNNVTGARMLRRELTETEQQLWEQVRDRRFRGLKFKRQRPVGAFVLDFYCAELRLAIEVDGTGHARVEQAEFDRVRDAFMRERGIVVLRIPAATVAQDAHTALERVFSNLPSPPLPQSGEGLGVRVTKQAQAAIPTLSSASRSVTGGEGS